MPVTSSFLSFFLLFSFFGGLNCQTQQKGASSSFDWFGKNHTLALYGDAEIRGSAVSLRSGQIVTRKPVRFFGARPGFSTFFTFSLSPGNDSFGISFFLAPGTSSSVQLGTSQSDNGQEMGLLPPNVSIAVEFIAVKKLNSGNLSGKQHVQIRLGHEVLIEINELFSYFYDSTVKNSRKLHSWIDYDGDLKRIQVRLGRSKDLRLINVSISSSIDLSNILWREAMLVGLSYSGGNSTQACSIYSWSFDAKQGTPYVMHSELLDPNTYIVRPQEKARVNPKRSHSWRIIMAMLFAAACGAMITFFVMFRWFSVVDRRQFAPVKCSIHPVDVVVDEKIILVVNKGQSDDTKK